MHKIANLVLSTSLLTAATVTAGMNLSAGPAADATPSNDITVVSEAIMASPTGPQFAGATGAINGCADTSYALQKWHATGSYSWYYNPANVPQAVAATALTSIQKATKSLFTGQNRCGTTVTLPVSQVFAGNTTKLAQVSPSATCTGNDGLNVTSWGTLPAHVLAYTCAYFRTSTGAMLSSDMLLATGFNWFTSLPVNCVGRYDLESTVVHERGHTAGLAHVDQATHGTQTMSTKTMPCDTSKRLLGAGDLAGLRAALR
jgi:hypothetical protein